MWGEMASLQEWEGGVREEVRAGGGSTERLWKCGKQGNEEGHVTRCKLKCRGGSKGRKELGGRDLEASSQKNWPQEQR